MMTKAITYEDSLTLAEQNKAIQETLDREGKRLLNFIKQKVPNEADAEDILQDVMYQFTGNVRVANDIERTSAWLFKVAKNKIIDFFRKKRPSLLNDIKIQASEEDGLMLEDILPGKELGPEDDFFRTVIFEEIQNAIGTLPEPQKEVFILNEIEGKSFKEIAKITGETINTLLSRKRYAIISLRKQLETVYEELNN